MTLTEQDLDDLVQYGEFFWQQTPYVTTGMEYNPEAVRKLVQTLADEHYLSVAKTEEGDIVGFIGVLIVPLHFNPEYTIGSELFFFVHPSLRESGLGKKILNQAEEELKERGVDMLTMSEMRSSQDMDSFYTGSGYVLTERAFSKVI